mmetsp:Transcript_64093/g.169873  ORF Transcript_64093/g.169873 Transcript_64093/m.169873 type:complete len:334 (-) Transcript_64093:175-1176(-)
MFGPQVCGHIDASSHAEPCRRALAQVGVRGATVRTPGIRWRLRVHVQLDVAHLIDPPKEPPFLVAVTSSLAAAHRNAEEVPLVHHHLACKGRHLSIIDHLQRHVAELFRQVPEDRHDLLLVHFGRHIGEDVTPRGSVVAGERTRGAATDGVDARKMLCRVLHRRKDHLPVVLGVRVRHIPLGFLGVQHLVVLHRHGLDVALSEVEGQATAAGVTATPLRRVPRRWQLGRRKDHPDLEGFGETTHLGHRPDLKGVLALRREGAKQRPARARRTTQQQPEGAALPDHLLDENACEVHRGVHIRVAVGEHGQLATSHAIGTLEGPLNDKGTAADIL